MVILITFAIKNPNMISNKVIKKFEKILLLLRINAVYTLIGLGKRYEGVLKTKTISSQNERIKRITNNILKIFLIDE